MPFFDDYLNFTNSFASDDQWSLDPYAGDDEDNIFSPNFRLKAKGNDLDDDDEEDYDD